MSEKRFTVALVGATGLVGKELLVRMEERNFPVSELRLFASYNTAGEKLPFNDDEIRVEPLSAEFYRGMDIIFFAAHPMVARDMAESAAKYGAAVIDASSTFRLDPAASLVVADLNLDEVAGALDEKRIISIPSATASGLALLVSPLEKSWGVERVIATTIHGSTSIGGGGFEEHGNQTVDIYGQRDLTVEKFPRRAAFNLFPQVGPFDGEGNAEAESGPAAELARLMGQDIPICLTAAQAPVFCGLALSLNVELNEDATPGEIKKALDSAPGLSVMDDPENGGYPDTLLAMDSDEALVGRIRMDPTHPRAFQIWMSLDNLKLGSSLNMIRIAEKAASLK